MESGHNTIEFIQCVFLLYVLHSMVLSFHLIVLKIMTAVTSQQSFPEMIKEIPPGHAKDLVLRLRGQTNRLVVNPFVAYRSFYLLIVFVYV